MSLVSALECGRQACVWFCSLYTGWGDLSTPLGCVPRVHDLLLIRVAVFGHVMSCSTHKNRGQAGQATSSPLKNTLFEALCISLTTGDHPPKWNGLVVIYGYGYGTTSQHQSFSTEVWP